MSFYHDSFYAFDHSLNQYILCYGWCNKCNAEIISTFQWYRLKYSVDITHHIKAFAMIYAYAMQSLSQPYFAVV